MDDPLDGKSTDPDGSRSMNPSRMRELHKTWTLADDVALLKNLERFSELIINNASMTLCCMDNLEDSLNNTSLKVKKVANNFQALADSQFIENRVDEEDDDVEVDREESMERSTPSHHNPPVNLEQAIANCAEVIENKFEALQIDSEDDKSNSNPVALIPKNAYQTRRLPHLIGCERFMNDETLGLLENVIIKDDDDDVEEEERNENLEEEEGEFGSESKEDDYSNFERKSETIAFSSKRNEQVDSLASSVAEKPSVSSSLENFKPEILTRHLSFEPPAFSKKPPLVPPDFIESQSSESEDAAPSSNSEESPTPSLTKGGLHKSKTFSSFKSDLANVLQARSMMPPPPRNVAPKRKMSTEFDAISHPPPMASLIAHEDETDRVKMDEDSPESTPRSNPVPSFSKSQDDLFQVPKTEVLPCYGKRRARVVARRRPPSRKPRASSPGIDTPPDEKPQSPSPPPVTNSSLLSPATDEEDLFLLPADGIPSDLSNNNLFTSASLLSPGDAIEDKPITTGNSSKTKTVDKWDPFECDDSDGDLFSSSDKPKPSVSAPSFLSKPLPKKSEPTKEPDLFASSDEDDFLKDELFINKRFKSLNLGAVDKNIFGDDDDDPFISSSGLKLTDDLAKSPSSDEDDLFSTKPSKTPESKVKTMSKTPVMKDPLLFSGDFNEPE